MKSVMMFDPKDSDEETATKYMNWIRDNNIYRGNEHEILCGRESEEKQRRRKIDDSKTI